MQHEETKAVSNSRSQPLEPLCSVASDLLPNSQTPSALQQNDEETKVPPPTSHKSIHGEQEALDATECLVRSGTAPRARGSVQERCAKKLEGSYSSVRGQVSPGKGKPQSAANRFRKQRNSVPLQSSSASAPVTGPKLKKVTEKRRKELKIRNLLNTLDQLDIRDPQAVIYQGTLGKYHPGIGKNFIEKFCQISFEDFRYYKNEHVLHTRQGEPTFVIPITCIRRVDRVSIELHGNSVHDRKYLNSQFEILLKPEYLDQDEQEQFLGSSELQAINDGSSKRSSLLQSDPEGAQSSSHKESGKVGVSLGLCVLLLFLA